MSEDRFVVCLQLQSSPSCLLSQDALTLLPKLHTPVQSLRRASYGSNMVQGSKQPVGLSLQFSATVGAPAGRHTAALGGTNP